MATPQSSDYAPPFATAPVHWCRPRSSDHARNRHDQATKLRPRPAALTTPRRLPRLRYSRTRTLPPAPPHRADPAPERGRATPLFLTFPHSQLRTGVSGLPTGVRVGVGGYNLIHLGPNSSHWDVPQSLLY